MANATNFSDQKIGKAAELEAKAADPAPKSINSMLFRKSSSRKKSSKATAKADLAFLYLCVMSQLYGLAAATLNPDLCILLLLYGIFLGVDFVNLIYSIGIRRILPTEFIVYGLVTTGCLFLGLIVFCYFLMTLNYDCALGSKFAYAFIYIGFLVYNYYQTKEIIRRTNSTKYEKWGFYVLLAGRFISLVYNLCFVSGIISNPATTGSFVGAGPCKTLMTGAMVQQEHLYVIFMELIMLGKTFYCAHCTRVQKDWKRFFLIVDNEIFTFVAYLVCEVVYMVFFLASPAAYLSYFNVFYSQFTVILFMVNATNFSKNNALKTSEAPTKSDQKTSKNSGLSSILKMKSRQPVTR
ncbi:hypothetical protein HDV01_004853 [Terramyces sp. JEL0728]|nr:hypothetical protein HDV01_004853 [Terramyces sp. JEL0728]